MDTIFTTIKQTYESNPNYWIFIGYWVVMYFVVYFLVYITEPEDKKGYLIGPPLGLQFIANLIPLAFTLWFALGCLDNGEVKDLEDIRKGTTYFVHHILFSTNIIIPSAIFIILSFILSKGLDSPLGGGSSIMPILVGLGINIDFFGKNTSNLYINDIWTYIEWIMFSSAIMLGMKEGNIIDKYGTEDKPYDKY